MTCGSEKSAVYNHDWQMLKVTESVRMQKDKLLKRTFWIDSLEFVASAGLKADVKLEMLDVVDAREYGVH